MATEYLHCIYLYHYGYLHNNILITQKILLTANLTSFNNTREARFDDQNDWDGGNKRGNGSDDGTEESCWGPMNTTEASDSTIALVISHSWEDNLGAQDLFPFVARHWI